MGQRRLFLVSVFAAACAGAPPRPAARNIEVATPEVEDAPLLAPAPAPSRLVVLGRVNDPRRWLRLERTPPLLLDLLRDSLPGSAGLLEVIDLGQPLEFAAGWDPPRRNAESSGSEEEPCVDEECLRAHESPSPDYWAAFSLGLKAWDPAALERLGFTPSGGGQVRENCLAARSLGSAPARLICSETRDQLQKLEAYMARGLPLEALATAPLHVEFRPQSLRSLWDRDFGSLEKVIESFISNDFIAAQTLVPDAEQRAALLDDTRAVLREANAWVHSLDRVALEAVPTAEDGLELTVTVSTNEPQPWLMAAYGRAADAAKGLPPAFAALPSQATSGGFSSGLQREDAAPLTEAARNLWRIARNAVKAYGSTVEQGYLDALDGQVMAMLDSDCLGSTEIVWANVPHPARKGEKASPALRRLQSLLGHRLLGTSPEARCGDLVRKSLKRLIASKDLQRALAEVDPKLRLRQLRAPTDLGTNTEVFELSLPVALIEKGGILEVLAEPFWASLLRDWRDKPQIMGPVGIIRNGGVQTQPKGSIALTVVVTATPSADWVGLSTAPDKLYELVRGVKTKALSKDPPRPELVRLKPPRIIAGDFFTLESLGEELGDSPALRALVQELSASGALQAPIISASSVVREARQMQARHSVYLPAPTVAALRKLVLLDAARVEALANELTPSAASPRE